MKNEGNEITQAVLNINGRVLPCRTIRRLTTEEIHSNSEKLMRKYFDDSIKKIHDDSMSLTDKTPEPNYMSLSDIDDEDEYPVDIPYDDPVDATSKAIYDNPFTDIMVHAKVNSPQGESVQFDKVQGITKEDDGNIFGTFDSNPILNSIIYDVEFQDGVVKQYAVNVIDENMYIKVDSDDHSTGILDVIVD